MTRFKDFGSGKKTDAEPLSFKLHGDTFECLPQIQGKLLLDLVADSSGEDPAKSAAVIDLFFSQVMTDDSYVKFNALLKDKNKIVSVETLAAIVGWLVEEYSDRPEEQPEA
jgi:hypothetical protein